jgi:3-demethoxyubiquinol 3-hydroxylase
MDFTDRFFVFLDQALRTVAAPARAVRPCPKAVGLDGLDNRPMSPQAQRLSASLMRVNHVGEVCAQAMYQAQALTARTEDVRAHLLAAAREETDHLAWTEQRLAELGASASLFNPLWYAGAFGLGLVAGRLGDDWSLGFVVETERQVEAHLASHLSRLPEDDHASRAIVAAMQADEQAHGLAATAAGGRALPTPVPQLMQAAARVMTAVAHRI